MSKNKTNVVIVLFAICIILPNIVYSINLPCRTYGTMQSERCYGLVQSPINNEYVLAGWTTDFAQSPMDTNILIIKIDSSGNLQRPVKININGPIGQFADEAYSIVPLNNGTGYVVTGWTESYGTQVMGSLNANIFVVKLNLDLSVAWAKVYGTHYANEKAFSIINTSDGGFALTGYTDVFSTGNNDIFVLKLAPNGDVMWWRIYAPANPLVNIGPDEGYGITEVMGVQGVSYAVVGRTLFFDPTQPAIPPNFDAFMMLIDAVGNPVVNGTAVMTGMPAYHDDEAYSVITDFYNDTTVVVVAGWTKSYGIGAPLYSNIFVSKIPIGSSGIIGPPWGRWFGWIYDENVMDDQSLIKTMPDGGYAVSGWTYSVGPGTPTNPNFWTLKLNRYLDTTGQWSKVHPSQAQPGLGSEEAYPMIQNMNNRNYAIAGWTNSFGLGGDDFHFLTLDQNGNRPVCVIDSQPYYNNFGWFLRVFTAGAEMLDTTRMFFEDTMVGSTVVCQKDVGTFKIKTPTFVATIDSGSSVTPACSVYNYGTTTDSFWVKMKIGSVYLDTVWIPSLNPGAYQLVNFTAVTANWLRGKYAVTCSTKLNGDMDNVNDAKYDSVLVVAPTFSVVPTTINFGIVGTSKTDSVTVTNPGTRTLNITNVVSDNTEFSVLPTSGSVPVSGSKKFYITFSPTSSGAKSGNIQFTHNAATSPDTVTVSGTGDLTGPSAPTLVSPVNNAMINDQTPTFEWNAVVDGDTYNLVVDDGDGNPEIDTNTANTTFTPTTSLNENTYSWQVRAKDVVGNWGGFSTLWSFTIDTTRPAVPTLVSPANNDTINDQTPMFEWNSVVGGDTYNLVVDDGDGNPEIDTNTANTTFTPTTVLNETTYYWQVRAKDEAGNWSGFSTTWIFTVSMTVPGFSVIPTSLGFSSVNVGDTKTDSVTVTNTGTATLNITNVLSDNGEFSVLPTNGSVGPSGNMKFYITFSPTSPGSKLGNIEFIHNAATSPDTVTVRGSAISVSPGWSQQESMPSQVAGKYVADGGALVAVGGTKDGDVIYAFRGKSREFYFYTPFMWTLSDSIPNGVKPTDPTKTNKKVVAKGAAMCFDGDHTIYATKGNGVPEFWAYEMTSDVGWTAKAFVPVPKGLKGGTSIIWFNGKVYLLAGNQKKTDVNNFFVYNPAGDTTLGTPWTPLASLGLGPKTKVWKDGACITEVNGVIYAMKSNDKPNYFFSYDTGLNTWTQLTNDSIPPFDSLLTNGVGKLKKIYVKDGAAMVNDGSVIYATKGGGYNFMWMYTPGVGWARVESVPRLHKKSVIKTGGAMTFANGGIYLLKGNKSPEFWKYIPSPSAVASVRPSTVSATMVEHTTTATDFSFGVIPNPFTKLAAIRYNIPVSGKVTIKLYNLTGNLIETIINEYMQAGTYTTNISTNYLAKGIYFLRYESLTNQADIKIIIQ